MQTLCDIVLKKLQMNEKKITELRIRLKMLGIL